MTVTEAITWYLARQGVIAPLAAQNTDKRTQALEDIKTLFTDIWFYRDWVFKLRTGQITVSASGNSKVLPSDFSDFGGNGGVFRNSDHVELVYRDPSYMRQKQLYAASSGSTPSEYSIFGQDTTSPFQSMLQTDLVSSDVVLDLIYNAALPTLDESSNVNNLKHIPEQFHESVIKSGLRALSAYELGDARKRDFAVDPQYQGDLIRMAATMTRRSQRPALPGFFSRGRR